MAESVSQQRDVFDATACGQLIRRIGPVQPKDGQNPKCVQCFFYGTEDAAKHRLSNSFMGQEQKTLKQVERIFSKLHGILISAKNKYIESFIGVKIIYKASRCQEESPKYCFCRMVTTFATPLSIDRRGGTHEALAGSLE